jgi:2'-5' RNA ligase
MMPPEVQAIALPLIRRWAPRMLKYYPAHLTVLFPFVEYPRLADGVSRLRHVCAEIAPFMLSLSGYKSFPQVAYMAPHPEGEIQAMLRRVDAAFPEAPPYSGIRR